MAIDRLTELIDDSKSFSGDAIRTTNYLDDYIVRGNVFDITLAQSVTQSTAIYFTSEYSSPTINGAFLLPLFVNPTSGYSVVKIYEDTEYTGGTTLTAQNRNRTSSKTSEVVAKVGATGSTKGTLIQTLVFGTAASGTPAGSQGGGGSPSSNSLILDIAKRYLYEITNSENAIVGIIAEFAEI